jgi:hypothetical protein
MNTETVPLKATRHAYNSGSPEETREVLTAINENILEIYACSEIYLKQLDMTIALHKHTKSWILSVNKFLDACMAYCSEKDKEVFGHNLRAIYEYYVRMVYYHRYGGIERYESSFFYHPFKYSDAEVGFKKSILPELALADMAVKLGFKLHHDLLYDRLSKFSHASFGIWDEFFSFYELLCDARTILYAHRMFLRISIVQKPFSADDWKACMIDGDIIPKGVTVKLG